MNKVLLLFATVSILALASCTEEAAPSADSAEYVDGIYRAAFEDYDSRGWKPVLEVQIRNKKIVSGTFDYVNEEGNYKSMEEDYAEAMAEKTGVKPIEAFNELISQMVELNSPEVDVVTGATSSSKSFQILAKAALDKAAEGDFSPSFVPWE